MLSQTINIHALIPLHQDLLIFLCISILRVIWHSSMAHHNSRKQIKMDEIFLYKRIAESIRQDILNGILQPNDRLPSIRELTNKWRCTPGTVQRAYQELAQQGLIISQAGKGTHVSRQIDQAQILARGPLRKATLVHKAEAFL